MKKREEKKTIRKNLQQEEDLQDTDTASLGNSLNQLLYKL
jgi:hypothetical protein